MIALTHVCRAWRETFCHGPLCGLISSALAGSKSLSTSNVQGLPLSICHSSDTRVHLPTIHSSRSSPTLLVDSYPCSSRGRRKIYKASPLICVASLLFSKDLRSAVSLNTVTTCSRPHSSVENSLHCAPCVWNLFVQSYLGGTWSTSHHSC